MKITFFSNYLNHHQIPFCNALYQKFGDGFKFVATKAVPEGRIKLGYDDANKKYPYVIETYVSSETEKLAQKLAVESDVVIYGAAPEKYLKARMKKNRITFRYSERIYRKKQTIKEKLRARASAFIHHSVYKRKKVYMLCTGAYVAKDFALTKNYINKMFKWGYFPETKKYDIDKLLKKKEENKKIKILWTARFLQLKHPEMCFNLALALKQEGYDFEIEMIGGEMTDSLAEFIAANNLEENLKILGTMPYAQVRNYMETADIFLFTSDFGEGWGAVVNEAMNSGCAVVASHAAGCVPFLIKDGENGFVYKFGDNREFYTKVKMLIDNKQLRQKIGKNAYKTIACCWNAEEAAKNFEVLYNSLLSGKNPDIKEGPGSRAEMIDDGLGQ